MLSHIHFRLFFYIISALIIYGSLYPFHFDFTQTNNLSISNLLNKKLFTSVADILGNILLFIPLGISGKTVFTKSSIVQNILLLFSISIFLALMVQIAQIFIPDRDAALSDVFWNTIGTATGLAIGFLLNKQALLPKNKMTFPLSSILLIGFWLFWQLLPFIPSLDIYYLKESVKELWFQHNISIPATLYMASTILLLGKLFALNMNKKNTVKWLLILILTTLFGKIIIITQTLDLSTIFGFFIGIIVWYNIERISKDTQDEIIFICFILSYTLMSLAPFNFTNSPDSFNLIPFAALLNGSMLTNTSALAEKLFAYIGLLWLIYSSTGQIYKPSIIMAIWITLLELSQTFIPDRVASISEPIWVFFSAWILNTIIITEKRKSLVQVNTYSIIPNQNKNTDLKPHWFSSWKTHLFALCFLIALVLNTIIQLPGIPYNVKELFLLDGNFFILMIFSFAILWLGIGSGLIAHFLLQKQSSFFTLPKTVFFISMISLILFNFSVTNESITDITGSNNIYWFIINKSIWGNEFRVLFETFQMQYIVSIVEHYIRYTALIGPLLIFTSIIIITMNSKNYKEKKFYLIIISSALLLLLFKIIVFDWSSTDNLNELIARTGEYGIGGGGYLYALLALICFNSVIAGYYPFNRKLLLIISLFTTFSIPLGWFLITNGLEQNISKYNITFSGVQFLLGPDRKQTIPEIELFLRWSFVQLSIIIIMALGIKFSHLFYLIIQQRPKQTNKKTGH